MPEQLRAERQRRPFKEKFLFSQSTFDLQTCVATKESKPGGEKKVRTKSIKADVRVAKEEKKESTGAAFSPVLQGFSG